MYKRIFLAYDGSESGQKALLDCHDIAQWSRSELFLIAVMPLSTIYVGVEGGFYDSGHEERDQREQQKYKDILDDGLQRLSSSGSTTRGEVVVGEAVDEITKYARKIDADLIVVGHRHLDGWAARWAGLDRALTDRACAVQRAVVIIPSALVVIH
jgi:nucleotide-binding universal stress UspA family protein